MNTFNKFFTILGIQRFLLALMTLTSIVLCFFADTRLEPEGWGLIFGVVVPAVPPLLFMLYGLDLLMSRVWRSEFGQEQVKRYDTLAVFDLIVMIVLAVVWLPIFLRN